MRSLVVGDPDFVEMANAPGGDAQKRTFIILVKE